MPRGTGLTATFSRTAVIAVAAAGLLLAGCGRKGALEPPPTAAISAPSGAGQPTLGEPEHAALEGERRTAAESRAGQRKSFPLDFLLSGDKEKADTQAREQRAAQERAAAQRR